MSELSPDAVWQSLLRDSGEERFDPSMVEGLPDAAQRYLLHAIAPGAVLSTCVEVEMEGRFRSKPGGQWMAMRGSELLALPGGFIWRAEIGGFLRFSGYDLYAGGQGQMSWKLWGVLPLLTASGPDVDRSARGRLVAEAAAWLPAALLPAYGARWEPINDQVAVVRLSVDGEEFPITVRINEDGAAKAFQLDRWGNHLTPNNEWATIPSAAICRAEKTFSGITIPSELSAAWWTGSDREFEFFEAHITDIRYH